MGKIKRRILFSDFDAGKVRDHSKTVVRRVAFWGVKPGSEFTAYGPPARQGLKGDAIARICLVDAYHERLGDITQADVDAEGFPEMTPAEFVKAWCQDRASQGYSVNTIVNRLEFEYVGESAISLPPDVSDADFDIIKRDIVEQFGAQRRAAITLVGDLSVEAIRAVPGAPKLLLRFPE